MGKPQSDADGSQPPTELAGPGPVTSVRDPQEHGAGAKPAARLFDAHSCPKDAPHRAWFVLATQTRYTVDGLPVVRLGDVGLDEVRPDVVLEGAATFVVCGIPVARKDDRLQHGGAILQGSNNLKIGGPKFALPPNIQIMGDAAFTRKVIIDLYFLSTTKTGKTILDRVAAHGKPVDIVSQQLTTATVMGEFNHQEYGAREGKFGHDPLGTTISYNPDDQAAFGEDEKGNPLPIPPQVGLGHELIHAMHFGEGTGYAITTAEEAQTVGYPIAKYRSRGYGPKRGDPAPTENDLRRELGLPERANYNNHKPKGKTATNLRPGVCP